MRVSILRLDVFRTVHGGPGLACAMVMFGLFALFISACSTPPLPTYRVDSSNARPWVQPSVPVSCLSRDSVEVDLRVQSLRGVVLWARDDEGYHLLTLDEDSLKWMVIPKTWSFQEVLVHDDCQPEHGSILRLILFVRGNRVDSTDFDMNDQMAAQWKGAFGPRRKSPGSEVEDRTTRWQLLGIDGDSAKTRAKRVVDGLQDEIRRRQSESSQNGRKAMPNEDRIKWLENRLMPPRALHSVTLERPWKGLHVSIGIVSERFQGLPYNPESLK